MRRETYGLQTGGNAVTEGLYCFIQVNADGSYTYTLTKPVTSTPGTNDGADTVVAAETFTYVVTDANGNTATGTITTNNISNAVIANEAGLVLTGLHDGVFGADGNRQISIEGLTNISGLYYYTFMTPKVRRRWWLRRRLIRSSRAVWIRSKSSIL
jgi:hypothetical protein